LITPKIATKHAPQNRDSHLGDTTEIVAGKHNNRCIQKEYAQFWQSPKLLSIIINLRVSIN
jgi:hypothetical protein